MNLFDLRTEKQTRPLGLGEFKPRFSWKVQEAEANYLQRTRRIQASKTPGFEKRLWDSGRVRDSESHLVAYAGPALEPQTRYWFRVKVTGGRSQSTPWSPPEWFETALAPGSWPAPFVSILGTADGPVRAAAVRRVFDLPFTPATGRLYATAQGYYELSVNSKPITDAVLTTGSAHGAQPLEYQSFDITDLLNPGVNTVEALLGSPSGSRLILSAHIEIRGSGGEVFTLDTDESWVTTHPALSFPQLHPGETYDARREGKGRWTPVTVVKAPEAAPVAQVRAPVVRRQGPPARRIATPGGEVLDFGGLVTGWVRLTASVRAGDRLAVGLAAALDAKGNFSPKSSPPGRFEFRAKEDGPRTFEPKFAFQSFRFVKVEAWPGEADPQAFEAVELSCDPEPARRFECSHPGLNLLHRTLESVRRSQPFGLPRGEDGSPEVPWERWRATGDLRALRAAWPSLKAWGESVRTSPSPTARDDLITLAYRAHRVGVLARSARVLGHDREASTYRKLHKKFVEAFRDEYLTPRGRLAVGSPTALALALAFHLIPAEFRTRNRDALVTLVEEGKVPFDPEVLETSVLCDVLNEGGRLDLAYGQLLKEAESPSPASVLRGAAEWMYRTVGGWELDAEISGFEKLIFHPQPGGGVTWARSSFDTPEGTAGVAWSSTEEGWTVELEVPPNASAVLVHREGRTTYGSGKWTREFSFTAR